MKKTKNLSSTIIFLITFISILSSIVSEQQNKCSAPYECKSLDGCVDSGGVCESSAGSCPSPNQCCCRPKSVAPGDAGATGKKSVIEQISEEVKRFGCLIFGILFYLSAGIAALFILFAGIKYMTSESESERCEARDRVFFGLIGLIVVIIAIPLVNYFIPVINSGLSLYSKDLKIPEVNCPGLPFTSKPSVSGTTLPKTTATSAMDIISIIERIICGFLSLGIYISSGLAALVMVYAGAKYIASADNPEEREKAKSIGAHAIIGLIIVLIALPLANFFAPYVLNCEKYLGQGQVVAKTCKDAGGICKNNPNACECVVNNQRVRGQYCIQAKGQYEDCEASKCCCICPTESKKGCIKPGEKDKIEEEGTLLCSDNTIFECKNGEWIKKTLNRVCYNGDIAECKNNNWEIKDCGSKTCDEKTVECVEKAKGCTKHEDCCSSYPGFRVKCIANVCDPCADNDLSCHECKKENEKTKTQKQCTNNQDCCKYYPGFSVKCVENVCDPCTSTEEEGCYKCEMIKEQECDETKEKTKCEDGLVSQCIDGKWIEASEKCDLGCDSEGKNCKQECSPGDKKCENSKIYDCPSGFWREIKECKEGCDENRKECKEVSKTEKCSITVKIVDSAGNPKLAELYWKEVDYTLPGINKIGGYMSYFESYTFENLKPNVKYKIIAEMENLIYGNYRGEIIESCNSGEEKIVNLVVMPKEKIL